MKLIECVPNISEGRDPAKIKSITDVVETVEGVKLLDVDLAKDKIDVKADKVGPTTRSRSETKKNLKTSRGLIHKPVKKEPKKKPVASAKVKIARSKPPKKVGKASPPKAKKPSPAKSKKQVKRKLKPGMKIELKVTPSKSKKKKSTNKGQIDLF